MARHSPETRAKISDTQRGNRNRVTHGASAQVPATRLTQAAERVYAALAEDAPVRGPDGGLPRHDREAVALLARALCRLEDRAARSRARRLLSCSALSRRRGFLAAACRIVISTRYGDRVSVIVSGTKPHGARGIADHHPMGMSTGVFADLRGAWQELVAEACRVSTYAVELSALSEGEFAGLTGYLAAKPRLPFRYVSVHAPVKNRKLDDAESALVLGQLPLWVRSIVAHPDALHELAPYRELGTRLVLENMDDRKTTGRTADELDVVFDELPDAGFCLDVAHAHSIDPTMEAAHELLDRFRARLRQVHVSSLRESHHVSLTEGDEERFASILERCRDVPWILEASPPQRWRGALKPTTLIAVGAPSIERS